MIGQLRAPNVLDRYIVSEVKRRKWGWTTGKSRKAEPGFSLVWRVFANYLHWQTWWIKIHGMQNAIESLVCTNTAWVQNGNMLFWYPSQLYAALKLMTSTPNPCSKNAGNMHFTVSNCRIGDVLGIRYARLVSSIDHLSMEPVSRPWWPTKLDPQWAIGPERPHSPDMQSTPR